MVCNSRQPHPFASMRRFVEEKQIHHSGGGRASLQSFSLRRKRNLLRRWGRVCFVCLFVCLFVWLFVFLFKGCVFLCRFFRGNSDIQTQVDVSMFHQHENPKIPAYLQGASAWLSANDVTWGVQKVRRVFLMWIGSRPIYH